MSRNAKPALRILVTDPLSQDALAELESQPDVAFEVATGRSPSELVNLVAGFDGWIVRSETRVTANLLEAATRLRAVARAGVGVDNVDLDAATRRGVLVMNTPFGNTISAAEHTIALLLSVCRRIPFAHASLSAGRWERKSFLGAELTGKTLGVVGLGKIGRAVAERALGLKMHVLAFDPFVGPDGPPEGVEVVSFEELLRSSFAITVHVPLSDRTRAMIGAEQLALCKDGVILINAARGGIFDDQALVAGLRSGKVGGVALDVFEVEPPPKDHPLIGLPGVVVTPHLGASTREAQDKVGVAAVRQLVEYLRHGEVVNAVNMPLVDAGLTRSLQPWLLLAEKIGRLQLELSESAESLSIAFHGEIFSPQARELCTRAVLKGFLSGLLDAPVNEVSARNLAAERGLTTEMAELKSKDFAALIEVRLQGSSGARRIAGALFGESFPRLVRIDDYRTDAIPEGNVLILKNMDVPGMLARIAGEISGRGINIANVSLARDRTGGTALALFNLDARLPQDAFAALEAIPEIAWIRQCDLGALLLR